MLIIWFLGYLKCGITSILVEYFFLMSYIKLCHSTIFLSCNISTHLKQNDMQKYPTSTFRNVAILTANVSIL